MNLSKNFTLQELTRSSTAVRLRIDNTPPANVMPRLIKTAEMLERIRAHLSKKAKREIRIIVTSGFRCVALNDAVGSKRTSEHLTGGSADFEAPDFGTPTEVCKALADHVEALGIGQLINEYPDADGWVHVGQGIPDRAINRVITIKRTGTTPGIVA